MYPLRQNKHSEQPFRPVIAHTDILQLYIPTRTEVKNYYKLSCNIIPFVIHCMGRANVVCADVSIRHYFPQTSKQYIHFTWTFCVLLILVMSYSRSIYLRLVSNNVFNKKSVFPLWSWDDRRECSEEETWEVWGWGTGSRTKQWLKSKEVNFFYKKKRKEMQTIKWEVRATLMLWINAIINKRRPFKTDLTWVRDGETKEWNGGGLPRSEWRTRQKPGSEWHRSK